MLTPKDTPKILMFNFDKKTSKAVEASTGIEVVRGYVSNYENFIMKRAGNTERVLFYYAPSPPYECQMVFINLDNYEETKKEFGSKAKVWTGTERDNLQRYWSRNSTLLVLFIGNTRTTSLLDFGVPLHLSTSSGIDKKTALFFNDDPDYPHKSIYEAIDKQIVMPSTSYLEYPSNSNYYYSIGTKTQSLIANQNGDILATSLSKSNSDFRGENPGIIVLPQVKKHSSVVSKIIKHFGSYYGVSLTDAEWLNSDIFYPPTKLQRLNKEMDEIIDTARKKISTREREIKNLKEDYGYLKDLLVEKNDVLADAVYRVLSDLLKLKVTKSDELNKSNPKEDLLVEVNGTAILIEVKGTKQQYPSLRYPSQANQHVRRQGLGADSESCLILNHDNEREPHLRSLAYSDEESSGLIEDIIFIDSRVLHSFAVDVIDNKITAKKAVETIFSNLGRVDSK